MEDQLASPGTPHSIRVNHGPERRKSSSNLASRRWPETHLGPRMLVQKVSGRIRFTDEEPRLLMRMSSARETALRALWGTDEFLDTTGSMET